MLGLFLCVGTSAQHTCHSETDGAKFDDVYLDYRLVRALHPYHPLGLGLHLLPASCFSHRPPPPP
jgi:hypothetical protein